MKRFLVLFIVLVLSLFSMFGCSKNEEDKDKDVISANGSIVQKENEDNSSSDTSTEKPKYIDYAVYLKHKNIPYIFGERFEIKSDDPILKEKTLEEIALGKLLNYDKDDFISAVPKNTKILGVEKKGSTVYVDFSKEFIDNMSKDKTLTEIAIASVVNTLTFFPENEKVAFKVEGKTIEEVNGIKLDEDFMFSSEFIPDK